MGRCCGDVDDDDSGHGGGRGGKSGALRNKSAASLSPSAVVEQKEYEATLLGT